MLDKLPIHRLSEFATLTDEELSRWCAAAEPPVRVEKHGVIRSEGDVPAAIFMLVEGWVSASISLPGGERQILKVHLPGDALGTPSMSYARAVETLTALTPAVIRRVPFTRLGEVFDAAPRLATLFMLSNQRERLVLMDRLVSIGRTSAIARLATMLLDFHDRLAVLGRVRDGRFDLPLIQEHIGDLLGLTAVHVNRTLRQLEDTGLIRRERQTISILDAAGLERMSGRTSRKLVAEPAWLPPSRPGSEGAARS